jgi:hypothetical protein
MLHPRIAVFINVPRRVHKAAHWPHRHRLYPNQPWLVWFVDDGTMSGVLVLPTIKSRANRNVRFWRKIFVGGSVGRAGAKKFLLSTVWSIDLEMVICLKSFLQYVSELRWPFRRGHCFAGERVSPKLREAELRFASISRSLCLNQTLELEVPYHLFLKYVFCITGCKRLAS